jgi:hypothetical protein
MIWSDDGEEKKFSDAIEAKKDVGTCSIHVNPDSTDSKSHQMYPLL